MKLKAIITALSAALASMLQPKPRNIVGRFSFTDVAFQYRMGAGFPGDVNRTHPAEIEPVMIDEDDPIDRYGNVGIIDTVTGGLRAVVTADQSDNVDLLPWGALVRPYPAQQVTSSAAYGAASIGSATPPETGIGDVLRNGLIMVQLNTGVTDPVKGGRVYVWAVATAGNHVQGGYETEASAGNTVKLDPRFLYNGPPDADGVTEISLNV